jgi:hypothetical protein
MEYGGHPVIACRMLRVCFEQCLRTTRLFAKLMSLLAAFLLRPMMA